MLFNTTALDLQHVVVDCLGYLVTREVFYMVVWYWYFVPYIFHSM